MTLRTISKDFQDVVEGCKESLVDEGWGALKYLTSEHERKNVSWQIHHTSGRNLLL